MMLSSSSVTRPSAARFARKRAMAGSSLERPWPPAQAFWPACETSTWPIAETSTPAMSGLVAVR
jgi:hypothetical protein